jgi:hypothetical protein
MARIQNITQLQRRIQRAETLYEGRQGQALQHLQQMKQAWHAGWTPTRIVIAGLGLGFLAGRSKPAGALGALSGKLASAPKLLQLLSAAAAMLGSVAQPQAAHLHPPRSRSSHSTPRLPPPRPPPMYLSPEPAYAAVPR